MPDAISSIVLVSLFSFSLLSSCINLLGFTSAFVGVVAVIIGAFVVVVIIGAFIEGVIIGAFVEVVIKEAFVTPVVVDDIVVVVFFKIVDVGGLGSVLTVGLF